MSMTVGQFQDALDTGLEGNSVIDSLVEKFLEKLFEDEVENNELH